MKRENPERRLAKFIHEYDHYRTTMAHIIIIRGHEFCVELNV